jgi:hypothetical protein
MGPVSSVEKVRKGVGEAWLNGALCGVFEAYGWLPWVLDCLMLLSLWAWRARRAVLCWLNWRAA